MVMEEVTEEPAEMVERVAALDTGKASLVCCVRVPHESKPGARRQEVRTYDTVTPALLELQDWLICQGVTRVVMEATSAYWKPPFYLLEDDSECWVVNARDVKNVPGRPKTDKIDSVWLCKLAVAFSLTTGFGLRLAVLGTEGVGDAPVGGIGLTVDAVGVDLQQDGDPCPARRATSVAGTPE
jgi:hypothetical protein